jgi:hypothetical protein
LLWRRWLVGLNEAELRKRQRLAVLLLQPGCAFLAELIDQDVVRTDLLVAGVLRPRLA